MADSKRPVVLMADDDEEQRALAKAAFDEGQLPADLKFVDGVEELMDYLNRRGRYADPVAAPEPSLVLLDLSTQEDAREAFLKMKADSRLQSLPVVVMTASQERFDVMTTYDLSAAYFVQKPRTPDGLLEVVRAVKPDWLEVEKFADDGNPNCSNA